MRWPRWRPRKLVPGVNGDPTLDAVVVGAGIAGLSAAWDLRDRDVLVLERVRSARGPDPIGAARSVLAQRRGTRLRRPRLGHRASSLRDRGRGGSRARSARRDRAQRPDRGRRPRPSCTRSGCRSRCGERLALIRAGLRLRRAVAAYERVGHPREGESPAETRRRVLAYGDDRTFGDWLGSLPGDADALFRTTVTRSTAEMDEVSFGHGAGYFALVWNSSGGLSRNIIGGAGRLIETIAAGLPRPVATGAEVAEVTERDGLVHVRYTSQGVEHEVQARGAVVATKAFEAARLITALPVDTRAALDAIPYGPTVVMAILTRRDGTDALGRPLRAGDAETCVQHALQHRQRAAPAQRRNARPGGSLMVYRSAHAALELCEQPDEVVEQRFLDSLYAIYPEARGIVRETILLKLPRMLPYVAPGRAALQPALERPLGRIHLAGDYLGGFYTDTSISTGQEAASRASVPTSGSAQPAEDRGVNLRIELDGGMGEGWSGDAPNGSHVNVVLARRGIADGGRGRGDARSPVAGSHTRALLCRSVQAGVRAGLAADADDEQGDGARRPPPDDHLGCRPARDRAGCARRGRRRADRGDAVTCSCSSPSGFIPRPTDETAVRVSQSRGGAQGDRHLCRGPRPESGGAARRRPRLAARTRSTAA